VEGLKLLKEVFIENPGEQSVTLVFEGNTKSRVNLPVKITWSESLARQISTILENKAGLN